MSELQAADPQGRYFALAPDGTRLPVIDVTNPAFAVPETAAEIEALGAAALREEERRGPLQGLFIGLFLRLMARRSRLIAAIQQSRNGYLRGLPTYVMKLGPDNLVPPYDTAIDKIVLRSPSVASMRLRLHEVAWLLADGVASELAARPGAPLALLNIAGGPSADSLNALLLLNRKGLLAGRSVRILIYDIDSEGPAFARTMLAALQSGPLAGADISLEHVAGSWQDLAVLRAALARIPTDAIVAASSEGGLFEYGTDTEIVDVLKVLAPTIPAVVGSVTRDDRLTQLLRRQSTARTIPRGLERFRTLAEAGGYRIAGSLSAPLSDQVRLNASSSGNAASRT